MTKQDPKGSSWNRPFLLALCFNWSLKYLDNSIRCAFPELFHRCTNPH